MTNVIVLISGEGTTLQSLLDSCKVAKVVGVVSNTSCVGGITRSVLAKVPHTQVFIKQEHESNSSHEIRILRGIDSIISNYTEPTIIVLAGFMQILSPEFLQHYADKDIQIINIHPSLLPKHKGLNTYKNVLASGDDCHGITIHYVSPVVDGGEIIFQKAFYVTDADNTTSLKEKTKQLEQYYYPNVVDALVIGKTYTN